MATVSLNRDNYLIDDGNDSKVVITDLAGIPGGRALDMTGFEGDVVKAGHIIKQTASGEYAPLGVSDGAYASLSEGESYAGVLKVSILKDKPMAAILTMGEINAAASPYPVTATIKAGLPQIKFLY
jgi:hypothetical protein